MLYHLASSCQVHIQPDCQDFLTLSSVSRWRIGKNFMTRKLLLQRMSFSIMLKLHAIKNFRLNEANSVKIVSHFKCSLQDWALFWWNNVSSVPPQLFQIKKFMVKSRREFKEKSVIFLSNTWIPWSSTDCWLGYWSNPQEFPSCTCQPSIKKRKNHETSMDHAFLSCTPEEKRSFWTIQPVFSHSRRTNTCQSWLHANLLWLCFRHAFLCTASELNAVTETTRKEESPSVLY